MALGVAESYELRIAALEEQVASLAHSVAQLEDRRPAFVPADVDGLAVDLNLQEQLQSVRQLTVTMFPGEVSVEVEADPEAPREPFFLFHAAAVGDPEELISRQRQWQREVLRLAPKATNLLRLSLAPA